MLNVFYKYCIMVCNRKTDYVEYKGLGNYKQEYENKMKHKLDEDDTLDKYKMNSSTRR